MKLRRTTLNLASVSILFLSLTLVVSGVIADIPKSSQTVTIEFWYTENDAEKPGILSLIADFESLHPEIDIEALQISFFDARNLFTNSFIAGTESDVLRATRDWIPEFAEVGMILPLTDSFNATDLADFIPASLEMVTLEDTNGEPQIWAYPQLVDTPAIMYNKKIFELAGIDTSGLSFNTSWTWEEYWGILMKLNGTSYTYDTVTRDVYATTLAGMMFGAQPYYFGLGARMFSNDTVLIENALINSTESRYALWFLKNITDSSVSPNWLDQGWGPLNPKFRAGDVAMINQGPWELKQNIEIEAIFDGGDNLGIVQLPHDEFGNQGAPVGMHGMIVSSHVNPESAKYDAIVEFIRFMTSVNAQKEGAIDYFHVPSRASVMDLPEVKSAFSYKYVKGYWDAVQSSIRVPISKDWAQLEADFGDRINDYLSDELTLDECIGRTILLWEEYLPTELSTGGGGIVVGQIPGFPIVPLISVILFAVVLVVLKQRKIQN